MPRMTRRSNPTGLIELGKSQVNIELSELGDGRFFSLTRIDLGKHTVPPDAKVICVIKAGRSAQRVELGRLDTWDKSPQLLSDLDASEIPSFRILIRDPTCPKLLASAERVRLRHPGQSESLIPIESVELGELTWRMRLDEDDGPVLQVNKTLYPNAGAAEQDALFVGIVLPEALRQVCREILQDVEGLDDTSDWRSAWSPWLIKAGLSLPPPDQPGAQQTWIEQAVERFCIVHMFCSAIVAQRDGAVGGKS